MAHTVRRLLCASVATLALAAPVSAAQITYGPSLQDVTFTRLSDGGLAVAAPQLDMPAFDTTTGALGGAWIIGLNFTTGPEDTGGIFPANPNAATFKYAAGANTLVETVSIGSVQDDTRTPKVYFSGVTTLISGDDAFLAAFGPVGISDIGDFVVNDIGTTLTKLVEAASASISAGEKVPRSNVVSEPRNMAVFGIGLVAAWWLRRQWLRRLGMSVQP